MINKNQTEIFRIGLTAGFIEIQYIINWADAKIAEGNNDYVFIEISTAKNVGELISILKRIDGEIDPNIVVYGFFSILSYHYKMYPNEHRIITKTLYRIVSEYEKSLSSDEIGTIYYLDEAFDLALAGTYGTIETFKSELQLFLNKYEGSYKYIFYKNSVLFTAKLMYFNC